MLNIRSSLPALCGLTAYLMRQVPYNYTLYVVLNFMCWFFQKCIVVTISLSDVWGFCLVLELQGFKCSMDEILFIGIFWHVTAVSVHSSNPAGFLSIAFIVNPTVPFLFVDRIDTTRNSDFTG